MRLLRNLAQITATILMTATALSPAFANSLPFEIRVDGKRVDGTALPPAQGAATTDTETAAQGPVDVQVKYDGLGVQPYLNVSTMPPRAAYAVGDKLSFLASLNYPGYITRAEVRLYESGTDNLVATLPVDGDAHASWTMANDAPDEMDYVLRVYDADGRYDETRARTIFKSNLNATEHPPAVSPGTGEDFTAIRNIDVSGGAVTIIGKNVPVDHDAIVMGELVPADGNGGFVVQRILPAGAQSVGVRIVKDGEGLDFTREVEIPESEWFYVGLADFTAGYRLKNQIETERTDEFDKTWTRGRLAFYLKGKIKGQYILTAAADTTEQRLKHIFRNLDQKDPREFLRRIDPDDYYPVYGDDSTSFDDAPTQGKFYVRLERGPSHVMWGNFKTNVTGTKFLKSERSVYGASGVYRSRGTVPNGEARTAVDAYAALPGTLPNRDTFRGTGGSGYFLKHQDITQGSETVSIETRNPTTGWVVSAKTLKYGDDYAFDYAQGVIILKNPLPSTLSNGAENYLTVGYEYAPSMTEVDGYVTGGRIHQWVGDHVRLGVSGQHEKTGGAGQKVVGADVHIEATPNTFVEAEAARSKGPGFGNNYSPNGGLTIQNTPTAGIAGKAANAYRAEARIDLADATHGEMKGKIQGRIEKYEPGFSSVDVQAKDKRISWGVEADVEVADRTRVAATYSHTREAGRDTAEAESKIEVPLNENVSIEPYAKYTWRERSGSSTEKQGKRLDVGSRIRYRIDDDNSYFVFGQATTMHTGTLGKDHRAGVGMKKQITDRVGLEGEVSYGTMGPDAQAMLTYEPNAESRYYLGYRLDSERNGGGSGSWPFALVGDDIGTVVVGSRVKINDQWSAFAEDSADMFGRRRTLTQTYGVTYTPNDLWTYSGAIEWGHVYDNTTDSTGNKNPDTERLAVSATAAYHNEGLEGRVKAEYRHDDSDEANKNVDSWLLQAAITQQTSKDWRMLANLDLVITDADETTRNNNYAEGSIGFAYRPTDNDKINALVKYTFLHDNPGKDQVTVDLTLDGASQRSHIFSADVNYDIVPQLTLGAKYGFRIGEIKDRAAGSGWTKSQAHLAIGRADWHVVKEWDAVVEGRMLWSPTTDQQELGFLVAVYRQIGENLKFGVGYNFGNFSDDLRDLSLDDAGVFVNVVGTF